jgi:acetyl esterase/lipase
MIISQPLKTYWIISLLIFTLPGLTYCQLSESATWAATVGMNYQIKPNITYTIANNWEAKLDVYMPKEVKRPNPTLIFIHGGGWVGGTKEGGALFYILPYLEMGWSVVNVEYRLAKVSPAPAAVEDCRCALRWVINNAKEYMFDTDKIVVSGDSAGGHLSLMTGILPASAGLDRACYGEAPLKVAAIINWYGITDVVDLLDGPNLKSYAVRWLGSQLDREAIAKRVSPLTYIRKDLPPILTIHGDADPVVPYSHAVRLHEALDKVGVTNQLLTIPGGLHGHFNREQLIKIYSTIQQFLVKNRLAKEQEPNR